MNVIGPVGRYLRSTRGVAAMEYALIVGVVVVAVSAAVVTLRGNILPFLNSMAARVTTAQTTATST